MSLTNATPADAARAAKDASHTLAVLSAAERNAALTAIHAALAGAEEEILAANAKDLAAAEEAAEAGTLSYSLVKRLDLGRQGKYKDMLQGILDVRQLDDPSESCAVFNHISTIFSKDITVNMLTSLISSRRSKGANAAGRWTPS